MSFVRGGVVSFLSGLVHSFDLAGGIEREYLRGAWFTFYDSASDGWELSYGPGGLIGVESSASDGRERGYGPGGVVSAGDSESDGWELGYRRGGVVSVWSYGSDGWELGYGPGGVVSAGDSASDGWELGYIEGGVVALVGSIARSQGVFFSRFQPFRWLGGAVQTEEAPSAPQTGLVGDVEPPIRPLPVYAVSPRPIGYEPPLIVIAVAVAISAVYVMDKRRRNATVVTLPSVSKLAKELDKPVTSDLTVKKGPSMRLLRKLGAKLNKPVTVAWREDEKEKKKSWKPGKPVKTDLTVVSSPSLKRLRSQLNSNNKPESTAWVNEESGDKKWRKKRERKSPGWKKPEDSELHQP